MHYLTYQFADVAVDTDALSAVMGDDQQLFLFADWVNRERVFLLVPFVAYQEFLGGSEDGVVDRNSRFLRILKLCPNKIFLAPDVEVIAKRELNRLLQVQPRQPFGQGNRFISEHARNESQTWFVELKRRLFDIDRSLQNDERFATIEGLSSAKGPINNVEAYISDPVFSLAMVSSEAEKRYGSLPNVQKRPKKFAPTLALWGLTSRQAVASLVPDSDASGAGPTTRLFRTRGKDKNAWGDSWLAVPWRGQTIW